MVDMFDTLGTLYAACERANLLDEKGEPLNMNQGMLSDAIATTIGSVCGTSTVTTFSEVNAGVAAEQVLPRFSAELSSLLQCF